MKVADDIAREFNNERARNFACKEFQRLGIRASSTRPANPGSLIPRGRIELAPGFVGNRAATAQAQVWYVARSRPRSAHRGQRNCGPRKEQTVLNAASSVEWRRQFLQVLDAGMAGRSSGAAVIACS
jgi:hypothetical protein